MKARYFIALILLFLAPALWAQDKNTPLVEVELEESSVIPGQYLTLRLTVLVPTWLLKPVEFPSLELPNLRVRLTERSTSPISRAVDGTQWSGVSRRYLLSPMVPGKFTIPVKDLSLTYADPNTSAEVNATLKTPAITLTGTLPKGAEDLDPFIAASGLTLTKDLTGPTADLTPGASVALTVTASVEGSSPLVLPNLLPDMSIAGVRAYTSAPVVTETDNRGVLSGTRVEEITLMAEGGGSGDVPGLEIRWFNLETKQIETASVDGFGISVAGPPATSSQGSQRNLSLILGILGVLVAGGSLFVWIYPRLNKRLQNKHEARTASAGWAKQQLLKAIDRRDYPEAVKALDQWLARRPQMSRRQVSDISAALAGIGAHLYGPRPSAVLAQDWQALTKAVKQAPSFDRDSNLNALPPLNPETAT